MQHEHTLEAPEGTPHYTGSSHQPTPDRFRQSESHDWSRPRPLQQQRDFIRGHSQESIAQQQMMAS